MLVGIVVKNKNNRFLILKRKLKNQIDLGLISSEVEKNKISQGVKDMLTQEIGFDFSDDVAFETLLTGVDADGEYLILFCEKDFEDEELKKVSQTEFLWFSFDKIKRFYKEGKLNDDQFRVLEKAENFSKIVKLNQNAMKVNHSELKFRKLIEKNDFQTYVKNYGDKRLVQRILHGRKIKPCGRECREHGYMIAREFNHISFENFSELMNDREFVLEIANISPNPNLCENYFYQYVNSHLKKNKDFRLEFLKAIYLNDNVYKYEDIITIVANYGLQEENKIILGDIEFKKLMKKRLDEVDYRNRMEYSCSGEDKKELHDYKVNENETKILCENMKLGLNEILNSFTVGEKKTTKDDEPRSYYEFLCRQHFKTI